MEIRRLTEKDWDTLVSWWDWWPGWKAPAKEFLPENGTGGIMIEKEGIPIVAGFIYTSNSKLAWLEFVISNPKYKENDRDAAITTLIEASEATCKDLGFMFMFSIGRSKALMKKHKELGWSIDYKSSYEMIKFLK